MPDAATSSSILTAMAGAALAVGASAAVGAPLWVTAVAGLAGVAVTGTLGLSAARRAAAQSVLSEQARAELAVATQNAGAALAESRASLDRAMDWLRTVDEPIIAADPAGRIIFINPSAEELLGVRADRVVGQGTDQAFTQSELLGLIEDARGGKPVRRELRVTTPDGPRVWQVSALPVAAPAGTAVPSGLAIVIVVRDVTEASLALHVKTDFVANASHELRTPIAAMRIALDTLGAVEDEDAAMRARLMGIIATNVGRLEEMVRDLLDLSRLESPDAPVEHQPISIEALARELAASFEHVCSQRGLTLAFDIQPGLADVRTDRRLLMLVLSNLVDNATKFAFEGSTVRIRAQIDLGNSGVRFEVIDKGVGIPLDQQPRIFERYYQVDAARTPGSSRRGTGLGLAIVKHAVRRLGGTIRLQSVWHQGTTITVELPHCLNGSGQSSGA